MNDYPQAMNKPPVSPEAPMENNLVVLTNLLYQSVADQRDILADCRGMEYNITPARVPQGELRKVDAEKIGTSITERLSHLLTVMNDTNELLRQHRNVLEGALIAG